MRFNQLLKEDLEGNEWKVIQDEQYAEQVVSMLGDALKVQLNADYT